MTTLLVGAAGLAGVMSRYEVDGGRTDKAALYLVASVLGGIAAAAAGYVLGRKLA